MCKDADQDAAPRIPKNLPPPGEKPTKPEGNVEPPKHQTKLSSEPNVLEGKTAFSDVALSEVSESA